MELKTMEHNGLTALFVWCGTMLLNIWAHISKEDVAFALSTTATVLAIAYYIILIRKNLKKNKDEKIP